MKIIKLVLYIVLSNMCALTNAQVVKISDEKSTENGGVYVSLWYNEVGKKVSSNLQAIKDSKGEISYLIGFSIKKFDTCQKGKPVLIKLKNGEIIELENITEINKENILKVDVKTSIGYSTVSTPYYYCRPNYKMPVEFYDKMCLNGVEKIRVVTDSEIYDFSGSKFVKYMKKYKEFIDNHLAKDPNSYKEGF